MKLLNIIISVTKDHKNLELTLDSIDKVKQDKNISVIILANDINIKKDLLRRFKFESKIIQSKKKFGSSYQEAINNCKCEYITFIDAGDFFDTAGFKQILDFLNENKPNVLRSNLAESYLALDGKPAIGIVNYTFVETPHAHYFKLDYLNENNIKFNEKLDIYALENFYRNALFNTKSVATNLTSYLGGFKAALYDKNHLPINVENIDEYYESVIDTFEMLQKKENEYYKTYIFNVLFSLFIIVESQDFNIPTLIDKKRKYEEIIYAIYLDYKDVFDSYDDKFKSNLFGIEFEKQRRTNINIRTIISFEDFLSLMANKKLEYDKSNPHFLDIIVPEYEGEEFIFDFLDSLAKQKDVNFSEIGVIIVNDASLHKIKPYKFKRYANLNIEYLINEKNVGQGLTRQNGIDHSKAEYITMFDQDDIFYDKDDYCLSKVIAFLKEKKPDGIITTVIEEVPVFNYIYEDEQKTENRGVYVHGLYCNRNFLNEIGLKFSPNLRQLEDTYFTRCFYAKSRNLITLNVRTYRWRNNKKSQVREKNPIIFEIRNFEYYSSCFEEISNFLKEKEYDEFKKRLIFNSLISISNLVNSNYMMIEELNSSREDYKLAAYKVIKRYKNILDAATKEEYENSYNKAIFNMKRHYPDFNVLINIYDFVDNMSKKYPNI